MKPRDTAQRLMGIVEATRYQAPDKRHEFMTVRLLNLVAELLAVEPTYGHAARIHELTGGRDNGNDASR